MGPSLATTEIIELARAGGSRREFRGEVLARLERTLGCDGGWFHGMDAVASLSCGSFRGLDLAHVERARAGWLTYQGELGPLFAAAAGTGVARIDRVFNERRRDRLGFIRDIARPLRIEQSLWLFLPFRGEVVSVGLFRDDPRRPFPAGVERALRPLVGILTLADAALHVSPAGSAPALVALSPRERQVVELVALGYRNREIALALGSAPLTVRNQLASVFRKLGATTRAELVGLLR